jgi:4,5-DOPA dioxygenase extradiol
MDGRPVPPTPAGRRAFLRTSLGLAAGAALSACGLERTADPAAAPKEDPMPVAGPSPSPAGPGSTARRDGALPSARMPVLFVGHGSPMNAVEDNRWSRAFQGLAATLPRPRAVLSVSAHWYGPGTALTGQARPPTIHDFGGFPPELYAMQYPAPGDPDLARQVAGLLGSVAASVRTDWGLDHGTWCVLRHLLPAADVPVVQLSLDEDLPPAGHLLLGRALAPLRDQGVLLLGSGNVTHNLRDAFGRMGRGDVQTPDWAAAFDADVARAATQHDADWLARAAGTDDGRRSHPTPDHWLPLLYAAGAADGGDAVSFPVTGFDLGSLSMRAVRYG